MSDVVPPGVRAVVFDLDGTLYRQGPLQRAMARRLLRAYLFHPLRGVRAMRVLSAYRRSQEELRRVPEWRNLRDAQLKLAAECSGVDQEEVARTVERWMELAPLDLLPRFRQPGLDVCLSALRSWGFQLGVLSDYPADAKLRALGIAEHFDAVVCAQQPEVGVFKPHPQGLHAVLARLGVIADHAVYVGDRSDIDGQAAAAAGMRCFILAHRGGASVSDGVATVMSFPEITYQLEPT